MDNLSHSVLGAAAAKWKFGHKVKHAAFIGAVSANLADLDVLISSSHDPLMQMEYHRHFTHALLFMPIGGLLGALPFLVRKKNRVNWRPILAASFLGYATHAPLDLMTSYGTQFLLPFSNVRLYFDWISIIDLFFMLPILTAVIVAAIKKTQTASKFACIYAIIYLLLGGFQHHRAHEAQNAIIDSRNHHAEHQRVMPTFSNLVLWRSIYSAQGTLYADGIKVPFFGAPLFKPGDSAPQVQEISLRQARDESQKDYIQKQFERFKWFADGFVIQSKESPNFLGDVRYSMIPQSMNSIWGIQINYNDDHGLVRWISEERSFGSIKERWNAMWGEPGEYRPVPTR